jgi:hypothetical protein
VTYTQTRACACACMKQVSALCTISFAVEVYPTDVDFLGDKPYQFSIQATAVELLILPSTVINLHDCLVSQAAAGHSVCPLALCT